MSVTLPYPPSINLEKKGWWVWAKAKKAYREDVYYKIRAQRLNLNIDYDLEMEVHLFPPNNRVDIDNWEKAFWDALQYAGLYKNDRQIRKVTKEFHDTCEGGRIVLHAYRHRRTHYDEYGQRVYADNGKPVGSQQENAVSGWNDMGHGVCPNPPKLDGGTARKKTPKRPRKMG